MSNTATTQAWTPPTAEKAKPKTVKIKAVGQWAFLNRKNAMSDKYQIDLTQLSEEAATLLTEAGIKIKHRADQPEKGLYIAPGSNNPIGVQYPDGSEVTEMIGNGTEFEATIAAVPWGPNQYGQGILPSIRKLVVTKLVEYVSDDDDTPAV